VVVGWAGREERQAGRYLMYFRYLEYSTLFMVPNIIRVRVAR
jgi:hypothetical protein